MNASWCLLVGKFTKIWKICQAKCLCNLYVQSCKNLPDKCNKRLVINLAVRFTNPTDTRIQANSVCVSATDDTIFRSYFPNITHHKETWGKMAWFPSEVFPVLYQTFHWWRPGRTWWSRSVRMYGWHPAVAVSPQRPHWQCILPDQMRSERRINNKYWSERQNRIGPNLTQCSLTLLLLYIP